MGRESRIWQGHWRPRRVQLGWRLLRQCYGRCPDRWVLQPSIIYDRAKKRQGSEARFWWPHTSIR